MMYNNKLAMAVKANGKVLREFNKDTTFVPFGSEYSLLIKNLNSVRVQLRVEIDGTDATEGTWLVIQPNSEMELTRFIKNGNLNEGNRFKFIERTAGIEQHRGVGVEDGLIRVEYQFEQPSQPAWPVPRDRWVKKEYWERQPEYFSLSDSYSLGSSSPTFGSSGSNSQPLVNTALRSMKSASISSAIASSVACNNATAYACSTATAASVNDAGITVPGSISDQKFSTVAWFPVETTKHVMVIKLLGETEAGRVVTQPVTVKAKPKCSTCGHVNKATSKFCSECGTSLTII